MKLDDLFKQIGEFGPYQKRAYILAAVPSILVAAESLCVIFTFFFPDHRCAIPGVYNDTYSIQSDAHAAVINSTIPLTDGKWDSCHLLTDDSVSTSNGYNGTIGDTLQSNTSQSVCDRWVFDQSVFQSTIATDLNLVCEHKSARANSNLVSEFGTFAGMLVCGVLSDRFGRKMVFVLSSLLLFGGGIGIAFIRNLIELNVFRFIFASARICVFTNGFIMGMEFVGPSRRMFAGTGAYFFWCIGAFYTCFFAYFIRNWRHLEIAISVPGIFILAYWWIMPESPRWLISKGKEAQAMAIFKKIADSNKTQLPSIDDTTQLLHKEKKLSFSQILQSRELIRRMIIVTSSIFVNLVVYKSLTLNITNLSGDVFVNFTITFILETIAYIVSLFALEHMGRKVVYVLCTELGGLCCTVSIVPVLLSAPAWVVVALSMVGRFFITISFLVIYLYGAELFPTVIRASAIGICICISRTGSIISPYLADLGLLVGGKFRDALPLVVMGSPAILVGLVALWLPETRNTALPEQLEDLDTVPRQERSCLGHKDKQLKDMPMDSETDEKDDSNKVAGSEKKSTSAC